MSIQYSIHMFKFLHPPPSWWKNLIPVGNKERQERKVNLNFRRFEKTTFDSTVEKMIDFNNGIVSFPITEDCLQSSHKTWCLEYFCLNVSFVLGESICQGSPFVPQNSFALQFSDRKKPNSLQPKRKECNKEEFNNYFSKQCFNAAWMSFTIS